MTQITWKEHNKRPQRLPEEMYQPWAGIFSIERKPMMIESEDQIVNICLNPDKKTNGIPHTRVIYKMLQAMYSRQTSREQSQLNTGENNGVGFNKLDAAWLSSVAENSKKHETLTLAQATYVGKKLAKYRKQLFAITEENSNRVKAIAEGKPVPVMTESVTETRSDEQEERADEVDFCESELMVDDYLCQVCGWVRDHKILPSTWVQGRGNVCPGCMASLKQLEELKRKK